MTALIASGDGLPRYHLSGQSDGACLVLVHGWGATAASWDVHVSLLTARYRVLTVDLPGHGGSPTGSAPVTMTGFAMVLANLLTQLNLPKVVAIGHSMGGQVVSLLATTRPDLTRGIVVIDPAYGASATTQDEHVQELHRLRRDGAQEALRFMAGAFVPSTPAPVRNMAEAQMLATAGPVLAQCFASMYLLPDSVGTRPASDRHLEHRRCPVLGVYSSTAAADGERAMARNPLSAVICWPECGHYLHQERPAEFVQVLETWLQTL